MEIQPTTEHSSGDKPPVDTSASALRSICTVDFCNQPKNISSEDS